MSNPHSDHAAIKTDVKKLVDWLTTFEVEVTSSASALYANGNQQVQITVEVEPFASEIVTPDQLNSISLYLKNTDGSYQRLAVDPVTEGEWAQQTNRNPAYDYYDSAAAYVQESGQQALTEHHGEPAISSKVLYVVSLAPGGSEVKLIAGIDYDNTTTFYSDAGNFASTVELTAHASRKNDNPSQFDFIRSGQQEGNIWTSTYRLRPATDTVRFAAGTVRPNGMIKWARNEPGNTFATIVGWVAINTKAIQYEVNITNRFDQPARDALKKEVPSASSSELIIFMQADNKFPYHRDSAIEYKGPLQVRGSDKQGNPIELGIVFEGTERTSLTLEALKNQNA